jgi:hypothetical protein
MPLPLDTDPVVIVVSKEIFSLKEAAAWWPVRGPMASAKGRAYTR